MIVGCVGAYAEPTIWMPPDRLIHPFDGHVTVIDRPHKGGWLFSTSSGDLGRECILHLPRVGDPGISANLHDALYVVELAHCNERGPHLDPNAGDHPYGAMPKPTGWQWPWSRAAYLNEWNRQWTEVDVPAMCRAVSGCP
jgi:hypothetical protein